MTHHQPSRTPYERELRRAWLESNGYLSTIQGEPVISLKAVALLADVDENRIRAIMPAHTKTGQMFEARIPDDLMRDMRRGANGIQARYGTNDMVDVLWLRAHERD